MLNFNAETKGWLKPAISIMLRRLEGKAEVDAPDMDIVCALMDGIYLLTSLYNKTN